MTIAIVLFTRDLRLADNPTLAAARTASDRVCCLFVLDEAILASRFNRPNRAAFLVDCVTDLDESLRRRGARLVVRAGDVAQETARLAGEVGADTVYVSADVSGYAQRRERRLRRHLEAVGARLRVCAETTFVVPPGRVVPNGKDHMAVFTPYHRRWAQVARRDLAPTPRRIATVRAGSEPLPSASDVCDGDHSPDLPQGGERAARRRMTSWLHRNVGRYENGHDDLAGDVTSKLSPYLHFGCVSPTELVVRTDEHGGPGAATVARQIAWRDFYAQVLAACPEVTSVDYRPRSDRWNSDPAELVSWKEGRTGYPIVDAGMRQLARKGWMHNRARLLVAHFLTKVLYQDWRVGAAHFVDLLVDADIANNTMNWQWVAGTGTDTRPNRLYNLGRQARRHDPDGAYARTYVPELATVPGPAVHEPWEFADELRAGLDYPDPIVDARLAQQRFRYARGL